VVSGSRDGNYLSQDLTLHTGTIAMAEPLQSAEAGDTARQHGVGGQGITDDLNGATRLNGWNVLNGLIPMRSGVNETWQFRRTMKKRLFAEASISLAFTVKAT
jgi:hypothetical protein